MYHPPTIVAVAWRKQFRQNKSETAHPEARSQNGDRHLLATAFIHQGSYDDVGVSMYVGLYDTRSRVDLLKRGTTKNNDAHETTYQVPGIS